MCVLHASRAQARAHSRTPYAQRKPTSALARTHSHSPACAVRRRRSQQPQTNTTNGCLMIADLSFAALPATTTNALLPQTTTTIPKFLSAPSISIINAYPLLSAPSYRKTPTPRAPVVAGALHAFWSRHTHPPFVWCCCGGVHVHDCARRRRRSPSRLFPRARGGAPRAPDVRFCVIVLCECLFVCDRV